MSHPISVQSEKAEKHLKEILKLRHAHALANVGYQALSDDQQMCALLLHRCALNRDGTLQFSPTTVDDVLSCRVAPYQGPSPLNPSAPDPSPNDDPKADHLINMADKKLYNGLF